MKTNIVLLIFGVILIIEALGSFVYDYYRNKRWKMYWLWILCRSVRITIGIILVIGKC